jgi:hypothetical protein
MVLLAKWQFGNLLCQQKGNYRWHSAVDRDIAGKLAI